MPRHPCHPRKGAFSGLLRTLFLMLWLGGTLAACGSALRPGAADQGNQGTPTPLVGTATPPVAIAQGTLHGTVVAGPTCPVERAEDPCPPKPVPGRAVVIASPAGKVVATVTTDGQGHFQVLLAPGPTLCSSWEQRGRWDLGARGLCRPRCAPGRPPR